MAAAVLFRPIKLYIYKAAQREAGGSRRGGGVSGARRAAAAHREGASPYITVGPGSSPGTRRSLSPVWCRSAGAASDSPYAPRSPEGWGQWLGLPFIYCAPKSSGGGAMQRLPFTHCSPSPGGQWLGLLLTAPRRPGGQ